MKPSRDTMVDTRLLNILIEAGTTVTEIADLLPDIVILAETTGNRVLIDALMAVEAHALESAARVETYFPKETAS